MSKKLDNLIRQQKQTFKIFVYRLEQFKKYRQEVGLNKFRSKKSNSPQQAGASPINNTRGPLPPVKLSARTLTEEERVVLDQMQFQERTLRKKPIFKRQNTNLYAK